MRIAILDPFSGISGDMMLGALVALGLDRAWLRDLPRTLGLDGVAVRIQEVVRGEIVCQKVEFEIPPQPHGRHIAEIRRLLAAAPMPDAVRARAERVFLAIAEAEGAIHGMDPDKVHLHEVGAVDAILDVVGAVWGLDLLGVEAVYCGTLSVGDGFVRAAHGVLPVPAPATLKLLEGWLVRPGPDGAGELVTPTGAALVRELALGPPPATYVTRASGFGAGTRDPVGRANALRIILADLPAAPSVGPAGGGAPASHDEPLVSLTADIDDMTPEQLAAAADRLRAAGALDVVLIPVLMKKGRPGWRVEVLADASAADALADALFVHTTSIGVRRTTSERTALARTSQSVTVGDGSVRMKVVTLPDGSRRAKPEFEDTERLARESGRSVIEVTNAALAAWMSSSAGRNDAGCVG